MYRKCQKNTSSNPLTTPISIVPFSIYPKQPHGCTCYYIAINYTSASYKPIDTTKLYQKLEFFNFPPTNLDASLLRMLENLMTNLKKT